MTLTFEQTVPVRRPDPLRRLFRTPKGLLIVVLALITAVAAPAEGPGHVLPALASAIGAAALADLAIVRWRRKQWRLPDGAILTGWILALVLSPGEPALVAAFAAGIAVLSKHLFRVRTANVFNPAALGLVAAGIVFASGQSWWGALPDLPAPALIILFMAGLFIANRVNKLPMVLAFLGAYYLLASVTAFAADPSRVAELFRVPDLNAALFFAFFMLDDPPTSPVRYGDQVWYGLIVAAASFCVFIRVGAVYYLPAGLLLGNAWEAWRRWNAGRGPATVGQREGATGMTGG